jgi:methyl-accepting chemotaxis protein
MKLKGRLITAFFIMIFLPVMLLCITAGTIVRMQTNAIQKNYDVDTDINKIIANPIQIMNRLTRGTYNEIKLTALKNPEKLEDEAYINKLNKELQDKYSFIAVRKGDEFIYAGNEEQLKIVKSRLQKFGVYSTEVDGGTFIDNKNSFLVKSQDFYFSDGKEGTIFVITDVNTVFPQVKSAVTQGIVSFLAIIIFTAMILLLWIYRGILRPLNVLRVGMNQIKDGDLDYSVESDTEDEIGQLCADFEEMRIRLKELIDSRLKYEDDIK